MGGSLPLARRSLGRHVTSLGLAVAMAVVNVLGYGSVLLVSGSLGPADFGAVAALTGLGVVCLVPGATLQVLVASRLSAGHSKRGLLGIGTAVGVVVALLLAALSPVIRASFSLDSVWPVVWQAVIVVPTTIGAVQQGILLGTKRFGGLSTLLLSGGASRLGASAALAWYGAGVTTIMAVWAVASVLPVLVGLALDRPDGSAPERWRWLPTLLRSMIALGALTTMTNLDLVLARHYLGAQDSGLYGIASMFARVIFWATQFIAMTIVPRLAAAPGRRIVVRAYLAVVVVASPALVILAVAPVTLLDLMGLGDYRGAADELIVFGGLGVLWACIQVSTLVGIARQRHRVTVGLWIGVLVQLLLTVLWHDSIRTVLAAALVGAVTTLVVVWAPLRRRTTPP